MECGLAELHFNLELKLPVVKERLVRQNLLLAAQPRQKPLELKELVGHLKK
jgi:hypothetical protein